jgi:hypothetical protein
MLNIRRTLQVFVKNITIVFFITLSTVFAQSENRVELGKLQTGAAVSFARSAEGNWGIEIAGGSSQHLTQSKPAQVEVFRGEKNISHFASGYETVRKEVNVVVANAKILFGTKAFFDVEDRWSISGAQLTLNRNVKVTGTIDSAGFYSAINLLTEPEVKWDEVKYLIPGVLYGEPHTRTNAPGGSMYYNAKHFSIREDYLSAPVIGLSFKGGNWAAILDLDPNGGTTQMETTAPATTPVKDEQIRFGALDAREVSNGGIEIGFCLPGTTYEFPGSFWGNSDTSKQNSIFRRRYNPVKAGFAQTYKVGFRFGKSSSFRAMERDVWRWAWQSLNPQVKPVDIEVVKRTLIDHLADRVLTVGNRAGIPFVIDAVSGKPGSFRPAVMLKMFRATNGAFGRSNNNNIELIEWAKSIGIDIDSSAAELDIWPKIVIGFCGKNVEAAEQFLMESDRDSSPRGQRLRELGTKIIESLIRIVPSAPPCGEGFDIRTGKPGAVHSGTGFSLRSWAEDMRSMIDLIRYERSHGRQHPAWYKWAKDYTDWLLTQQRKDGSFPMTWEDGTGKVKDGTTGVTSYAAVPLLIRMSEETGNKKYLNSAISAADYIWKNFGSKCVFLGATGTPTVADKESGMLSTEAFLSLYENTKDKKWLDYAKAAGDYTESWIWIWNVPMPVGAKYEDLGWKPGVPTIGVNGIGSDDVGGVDQYLDWAVPIYARLFKYTSDKHYLDVARILLHGTKVMLALPGRSYDLKGPGWQQEHWRMGPVRGIGAHRTWLPWISINHLHGIMGLEEFDPVLYKQLSNGK